jgi:hypothetical protein
MIREGIEATSPGQRLASEVGLESRLEIVRRDRYSPPGSRHTDPDRSTQNWQRAFVADWS